MIKKAARIPAPVEQVRAAFLDFEGWVTWMPGVSQATVLERSGERAQVAYRQTTRGRTSDQIMDFRIRADGLRQVQRRGPFRRWEADWRFLPPPDGGGTTLSLGLDFDLGWVGIVSPRRLVQAMLDEMFDRIVTNLTRHLREQTPLPLRPRESEAAAVAWLEVYETPLGLEVVLDGQTYQLAAGSAVVDDRIWREEEKGDE